LPEHLRAGYGRDAHRGRARRAARDPRRRLPRHLGGPSDARRVGVRRRDPGLLARAHAPAPARARLGPPAARRPARPHAGAARADHAPARRGRAPARPVGDRRRRVRPRAAPDGHALLPADHGGDAPARPQLHARKLPRRPRVRLARPADARGGRRVMDATLARGPLLAWLERHAPTARELRRYARIFARSASSLLGLGLVLAFLLVAAAGPFIVPYPEDARGAVHLDRKLQAPSAAHWFGTDEVGNDIYTRVILGARLSLW